MKRKKTNGEITPDELVDLRIRDIGGILLDSEIELAKKHGVLRYDLVKKADRHFGIHGTLTLGPAMRMAPYFDGHGKPIHQGMYLFQDHCELKEAVESGKTIHELVKDRLNAL